MDLDDDLDGLLALEEDLTAECSSESRKRSATSKPPLLNQTASVQKRLRVIGSSTQDDQELLNILDASQTQQGDVLQNEADAYDSFNAMARADAALRRADGALASLEGGPVSPVMARTLNSYYQETQDRELLALLDEDPPREEGVGDVERAARERPGRESPPQRRNAEIDHLANLPSVPYYAPCVNAMDIPGAAISVMAPDGTDCVFCKLQEEEIKGVSPGSEQLPGAESLLSGSQNLDTLAPPPRRQLLSKSIGELMRAVDRTESRKRQRQRSRGAAGPVAESGETQLWTDKYAPRSFMDLLSDEQANREVVRWLKGWDRCVFGRRTAEDKDSELGLNPDPLGRPEQKILLLCGAPGLGKTTLAHVAARHCGYRPLEVNASDDRSAQGLSERVLAAVSMREAVGEPRPTCLILDEIDGAVGGSEGRSAIHALLKIVRGGGRGPGKSKETRNKGVESSRAACSDSDGSEDGDYAAGKASKPLAAPKPSQVPVPMFGAARRSPASDRQPLLRRPIIAICNDAYAPALAPLRAAARVFALRAPSADRLAARLWAVCQHERIAAEKTTLRALAERSRSDVRACLHSLQLYSRGGGGGADGETAVLRWEDILKKSKTLTGMDERDCSTSAFQVWEELLWLKKGEVQLGRAALRGGGGDGSGPFARTAISISSPASSRALLPHAQLYKLATAPNGQQSRRQLERLLRLAEDQGEGVLLAQGLHDALPRLGLFDVGCARLAGALARLSDSDGPGGGMHGHRTAQAAHLILAAAGMGQHERPRLRWPREEREAVRARGAQRRTLEQWRRAMSRPIAASLGASPRVLALDLAPRLPGLLQPRLRPVARRLYAPEEAAQLRALVERMLGLGLRFEGDEAWGVWARAEERSWGGVSQAPCFAPAPLPPLAPPVHSLTAWGAAARAHNLQSEGVGRTGGTASVPRPSHHGQLTLGSVALQVVRQTLEIESIRQKQRGAEVGGPAQGTAQTDPPADPPGSSSRGSAPAAPNSKVQRSLAERLRESGVTVSKTRKVAGGWMDELRSRAEANARRRMVGGEGVQAPAAPVVLYKFHEGYTNAVKRPLLMSELL